MAKNPKSRKILLLNNHEWNIFVEVRREHDGTYNVEVYSQGVLKKIHNFRSIRAALISACDIVGEA